MKIKLEKSLFGIFFFFQTFILLYAQDLNSYNRIYTKTYIETAQKDPKKALEIADSLFTISETPRLKAKSLMLSATLVQQSGDFKKAIHYAMQAEQAIKNSTEYTYQSKIYGFLATQYRNNELYELSKEYTDKALQIADHIEDPKTLNSFMVLIWQEKAYYELDKKNYHRSISFIHTSEKYLAKDHIQNEDFLTANNDQLLGLNYFRIKDFEKSLISYQKALKILDLMPDNFLKGLVLNGIAQVYIETKKAKEAKEYIALAEKIAEQSEYLNLKIEIYKTSKKYYSLIKDIEKLEQADVKQDSITEIVSHKSSLLVNDAFSKLNKKQTQIENEGNTKNKIILFAVLIINIGSINILIRKRKQKKNKEKQTFPVLQNIRVPEKIEAQPVAIPSLIIPDVPQNESKPEPDKTVMSPVAKQKILNKLDKFEKSILFTRKNMSLSFLASYCDTNARYLSYVINTYRQKDVKNYINDLRIHYILKKINEDSRYKKLKISALADETGFSTQSKFATAFRKITSVSPSDYLRRLAKEELAEI